jgi:hypothetical protein
MESLLGREFVRVLGAVGNVRRPRNSEALLASADIETGKRRKVRCQLSSEDVPICSGCISRGTTCLSQEYPEERDTSTGNQVGERLGRVERLLETLVSKIESFEEEENVHKIMTPESVGNDVLTPFTTNASANPNVADNAPFLSLFENSVVGSKSSDLPTGLTMLVWSP